MFSSEASADLNNRKVFFRTQMLTTINLLDIYIHFPTIHTTRNQILGTHIILWILIFSFLLTEENICF